MSTQGVSGVSGQQGQQTTTGTDAFSSLNTEDFIHMLVAELQNQDPTNPTSNSEILQEVGQIRSIQANDSLTTTLQSVQLGQSLATAGSMINQTITGLDSSGNAVSGKVDSVSIDNNVPTLHVGDSSVTLPNVTGILPAGSSSSTTTSSTSQ